MRIILYYYEKNFFLYKGNNLEIAEIIDDESIDMIFADPPYFLSNGGLTFSGGKIVPVKKGNWDEGYSNIEDKIYYNRQWINKFKDKLKENGTIWITGTFHNIYSVGVALEMEGFEILNNITWQKTNPPPNFSCRFFTHSTETIIWARKKGSKHYYNYDLMKKINDDKQHKDVWTGSLTRKTEKRYGKYKTQKPEYLLEKIILSSTAEGDTILDPFNGSGTSGVVAKRYSRKYIGIDKNIIGLDITIRRVKDE